MSEQMKQAMDKTKGTIWKYFGAMMMEEKNGQQAASYTRTLGLVLFIACLTMWYGLGGQGPFSNEVPESMLYTLWGLIGIKGAKDVASQFGK